MTFSDMEVLVSQAGRVHGFVRDNIPHVWTPGGPASQPAYSLDLAGAMLWEADEFFDRALVLYFLRTPLRKLQAATWADVAVYYANYFSATSFVRLHMNSITQLSNGECFGIRKVPGPAAVFEVSKRAQRFGGHREVWKDYYALVTSMGWPSPGEVSILAPIIQGLRYREQAFRERVNYSPGHGFSEIHLASSRYERELREILRTDAGPGLTITDAAYNDLMAGERLTHVAKLLVRLSTARHDQDIERRNLVRRKRIIERYARTPPDKRFGLALLG